MGFFHKILTRRPGLPPSISSQVSPLTVCAPFTGQIIPLDKIPDPVFSQGLLGPGCGLEPAEETVYAPFDGIITQVPDTLHAVGITSSDGIELLIHVGIDTVAMQGKGFFFFVKTGQSVNAGDPLMTFSISAIRSAGYAATAALIITNGDQWRDVALLSSGYIEHGKSLMKVIKKA